MLANDAVELAVIGALPFDQLGQGQPYRFQRIEVPIRALADQELLDLSRSGQLALSLAEMKAIQRHFAELGRDPTDCELETLAQTWSEHCSHKTLRGRIAFRRADDRQPAQANDLSRDPRAGLRLARERLQPTTPASSGSTTSTTSASRSRRTTIPRPSTPTAGPTRAWAA